MNARLKCSQKSGDTLSEAARITVLETSLAALEQRLASVEGRVVMCGTIVPITSLPDLIYPDTGWKVPPDNTLKRV